MSAKPRRNGGQQTNCRVNALANESLTAGHALTIWYRITSALGAADLERDWMTSLGMPKWNRKLEAGVRDAATGAPERKS